MMATIIEWYDIAWFWFGRGVAAMLTIGCAVAIIATICEYIFGKVGSIRIFAEFLAWRKREGK